MAKRILRKIWDIFSYFLAIAFVISATVVAYFYANGYRFNPINGEVRQTGVLNIETVPNRAEIFINGKDAGKSPKVSAADAGEAFVKITKEGYFDWEKGVPVVAEKSTTIQPVLFLQSPQTESVYSAKGKVIQQFQSTSDRSLILLILQGGNYKLLRYETDKRFWNLSDNPQTPYTISSENIKSINFAVSKDGRWALVTKTSDIKDKTFDLVKLSTPHQVIKDEELDDFAKDYTIKWSQDSNYLILESNQDIISYRFFDSTKYLLLRKSAGVKYIWNSDSEGFLYYATFEKGKDSSTFSLIQMTLQGNNKKTLLKDVYLQSTDQTINQIREQNELTFEPMVNSNSNFNFAGELQSFEVIPNSNGVFIVTSLATYWFNQEENNYIMVYAKPSSLLSVAPDSTRLLFFDSSDKTYAVFSFKQAEADPYVTLGTHTLFNQKEIKMISWLGNSTNLTYVEGDSVYSVEYDGSNNYKLIKYEGSYTFSRDSQFVYTVIPSKSSESLEILRYKMY
ncbi:PEGA domain-containing protein [bacterium]|nr:PEGA domain-containing protein [bacterium]